MRSRAEIQRDQADAWSGRGQPGGVWGHCVTCILLKGTTAGQQFPVEWAEEVKAATPGYMAGGFLDPQAPRPAASQVHGAA